jgi:hypothetical protein
MILLHPRFPSIASIGEHSQATQREETSRWREGKSIRYVNWEAERLKPNEMRRQQKRVDHFQYIPHKQSLFSDIPSTPSKGYNL